MIADAPCVGAVLPSLLEFLGGSVLVGHNLRFDLSFIDAALVAHGREPLSNDSVDTLPLARRLVRDSVPDCTLATLSHALRLSHRPCHRALDDVLATGDLLHALLERVAPFGIVELGELLRAPRLLAHPQGSKLRLSARLPHTPGVFWCTDAAGHVLCVDGVSDLRSSVRVLFDETQPAARHLLCRLHSLEHRVCPDPRAAREAREQLAAQWVPPFTRGPRGHIMMSPKSPPVPPSERPAPGTRARRRPGRRPPPPRPGPDRRAGLRLDPPPPGPPPH